MAHRPKVCGRAAGIAMRDLVFRHFRNTKIIHMFRSRHPKHLRHFTIVAHLHRPGRDDDDDDAMPTFRWPLFGGGLLSAVTWNSAMLIRTQAIASSKRLVFSCTQVLVRTENDRKSYNDRFRSLMMPCQRAHDS
jgi:hypothetical protein